MSKRQAEILALRRQLLVLQSGLQRLHMRRDTRALAARSNPLGLLWRWGGGQSSKPTLPLLAALVVAAWRHWFGAARR
jgi:hypothetical protein